MKTKKKKIGRPRDGKEVKIPKSLKLEPYLIDVIKKDFPSFNGGIETLILNYISCKSEE